MLLGNDADLIQGHHGRKLYDLAGYGHENNRAHFEIILADLAAIACAYFVAKEPPKPQRKLMENYVFEPVRDASSGRWHFEISDRLTGELLFVTPVPRRNLEIARLDCKTWFESQSREARELVDWSRG